MKRLFLLLICFYSCGALAMDIDEAKTAARVDGKKKMKKGSSAKKKKKVGAHANDKHVDALGVRLATLEIQEPVGGASSTSVPVVSPRRLKRMQSMPTFRSRLGSVPEGEAVLSLFEQHRQQMEKLEALLVAQQCMVNEQARTAQATEDLVWMQAVQFTKDRLGGLNILQEEVEGLDEGDDSIGALAKRKLLSIITRNLHKQ